MNILITGSRSAKTFKLLKFFEGEHIFLADYGDAPLGSSLHHFISLGEFNTETIAHNLLNNCLDYKIDIIIPLHLTEIESVAKSVLLFNEFGTDVLVPETAELDKFVNAALKPIQDLAVIHNGARFGNDKIEFAGLSGVFYTDEHGLPYKLFILGQ